MTELVNEPMDNWEDFDSDDEVETLVVKEEVSKEVVNPNKEKREALQKEVRHINALIFANNDKLEDLKKSSKELLLKKQRDGLKTIDRYKDTGCIGCFTKNYLVKFQKKIP